MNALSDIKSSNEDMDVDSGLGELLYSVVHPPGAETMSAKMYFKRQFIRIRIRTPVY